MPDEPDPQLLRWFAESRAPLDDAHFVERAIGRLRPARGRLLTVGIARTISAAILSGLATGIAAPLKLRRAGLLALVVAAVTLWTGLQTL